MDFTTTRNNPNPRDSANPLAVLFFTYTFGMFKKGLHKNLDVDDLYNPTKNDTSTVLGDRLEKNWNKYKEKAMQSNAKPSFLKVLIATYWPEYLWLAFLLLLISLVFELARPIALGKFLLYFRPDSTMTKIEALWYAGAIVGLNGGAAITQNQYLMDAFHYGMRVRAGCCALLYRKSLKLSKTALGETASGKIVNLLSNDVSRFDSVSILLNHMWIGPILATIILYLLYAEAGYAGIVGVIPIFLVMPLQSYTGKLAAVYRKRTAEKTDVRVRLMDEIISGIQVIKMYAWEEPFTKLVQSARQAELKVVIKSSYIRALYMTFNLFTTRVAIFCTLLAMALSNQAITAARVFVVMSYFNILAYTMTSMFVRGISEVAEALVAVSRIQEFLNNNEYVDNLDKTNILINDKTAILLQNYTSKWNPASTEDTLVDINLIIPKGTLTCIIGPVGSGKSSFLQSILGELEVTAGTLEINGTLSYASQEPWVFAATLRQNILFGSDYDKTRYNEVIRVCALQKDLEQLPNGDLTIVGDRGASLSGGQKARVNLARAVYRKADVYLLDDPLSAVDIHVSKHLYDKCINGYLKNKTRILVTHQVHNLHNAYEVIIFNNGRIEIRGTFQELSISDNIYAQLLTTNEEERHQLNDEEQQKFLELSSRKIQKTKIGKNTLEDESNQDDEGKVDFKTLQEESSKGKVSGSLFWRYCLSGSNFCFALFVLVLYLLAQIVASFVDYFVSFWINVEEYKAGLVHSNTPHNFSSYAFMNRIPDYSNTIWIYIYTGLVIALFVIAITRSMLFYKMALLNSQKLHDCLFNNVINFSMRFFDCNSSGRILNRFAKDIGNIDEILPKVILDAAQLILIVLGSIILVTIVNPYFLIVVVITGFLFIALRAIYLKSSKNIKRLEGIMRSPVFTHLNATLQGLTTIRAFKAETVLKSEFDRHQDYHTSAYFMFIAASSAFGFYLDVLCFVFVSTVTFSFVTFGEDFGLKGGEVGLAITQAIALTMSLQWGVRQSAEVANHLMSVERILEYDAVPKEMQPKDPAVPADFWPDKGKIAFHNMGLSYADDSEDSADMVLNNLNFIINAKEKIGIVGRTGAGKSSLIAALFRLARVDGAVVVDDIDTKTLTLQTLRARISIIPQDPILFSGTLRYNLDPFDEYPDDVLYKALNDVELKDPSNVINRLENRVMDRGSNYSVGQKQLICLARALIRNNKILMLDEATANIDPQTDAVIQRTIRDKFAECTILTVAHRLNTIMDSDKVLVMERGRVVEYNHPFVLLQNEQGTFYKMVKECGRPMSDQLEAIARDHYYYK